MNLLPFLQICCAAGVDLSGGRTKDGGSIVGASVFYDSPEKVAESQKKLSSSAVHDSSHDAVQELDQELKVGS